MAKRLARGWAIVAAAAVLAALAMMPRKVLSQGVEESRVFVLAGEAGQASIVRIRGKSYVNLEDLARLTRGSLTFSGSQTTLTLPGETANDAGKTSPGNSEFSKEFLRSAIEEMAVIREWRIALTNAVQKGVPVVDDWISQYRGAAQRNLRLASVAASTDSDRNAYQLVSNEFENMRKLSDRFVGAHTALNYTEPDVLNNDPLDQQILSCARSLAAMAASGQYVDDGSCH